jgi:hypothetical protein
MNARIARWLAWSLFALAVALRLGALSLSAAITRAASAPGMPLPPQVVAAMNVSWLGLIGSTLYLVMVCAFSALGALIVSRQPAHVIGWLFCAIGVELAVEYFTDGYAIYSLFVARDVLPGGLVAGWIQHWVWIVGVALFVVFVPLRFPTGRLVSARWRPAWWLAVGVTAAGVLLVAFAPGPLANVLDGADIPNPLGVGYLAAATPVLIFVLLIVFLASILLAVASLVVRLRRARGVERQQIKWFVYIAVLLALLFVLQTVVNNVLGISFPPVDLAVSLAWGVALIGLPLAMGLAILRYRLFDIDVIIRRTLVYGTLTALLAGLYLGLVIGVGGFVRAAFGLSEQEPVVLVVSTLAVASLTQPLRQWIQRFIDRRFYRNKYDAARTAAAFGATLRSEVDLAQLSAQLVAVVEETMQPAHISLWLRAPTSGAYGSHEQSGNVQAV